MIICRSQAKPITIVRAEIATYMKEMEINANLDLVRNVTVKETHFATVIQIIATAKKATKLW